MYVLTIISLNRKQALRTCGGGGVVKREDPGSNQSDDGQSTAKIRSSAELQLKTNENICSAGAGLQSTVNYENRKLVTPQNISVNVITCQNDYHSVSHSLHKNKVLRLSFLHVAQEQLEVC